MKKRLQGLIAGVLIGVMLTSGGVLAKQVSETINAVYMNVKLVIDGEEITPKDANGNVVEPFIYNGTTYLPVRAVGEAFNKDVHWDGETATVYVGDIVKPAKEVFLYDKPYKSCENIREYISGKEYKAFNFKSNFNNFIGFQFGLSPEGNRKSNVVYSLNGLAKKVKGTFAPPEGNEVYEGVIKFYNENGKLLYQSPILRPSVNPIEFVFDTHNCLELKIEFEIKGKENTGYGYCAINDFAIITTDY
ncbi:MAG: copper amine oxidase N-terminal domain-containing protein [Ruminococcaceae bacterium]|nr:copper amine oxidase N-terminal domain-containing protein [Oscillospiraceae bacterium]